MGGWGTSCSHRRGRASGGVRGRAPGGVPDDRNRSRRSYALRGWATLAVALPWLRHHALVGRGGSGHFCRGCAGVTLHAPESAELAHPSGYAYFRSLALIAFFLISQAPTDSQVHLPRD